MVGVDAIGRDAELLKRGPLGGEVLLVGRAAGVADGDRGHGQSVRMSPLNEGIIQTRLIILSLQVRSEMNQWRSVR